MPKKIIKTKREDAEAVLVTRPDLVAKLEKAERGAQIGKAGTQPLLIEKANGKKTDEAAPGVAEEKHELAPSEEHDPDPEQGHAELSPSDDEDHDDDLHIEEFPGEEQQRAGELEPPSDDEIIDLEDEVTDKLKEKPRKEAKAKAKEVETPEEEAAESAEEEASEDEVAEEHMPMGKKMMGKKKMPPKMEAMATEAMAGATFSKALTEDPLVAEAREVLAEIYKALADPNSGNVRELLAQGAEFVGALRDYANVVGAGAEAGEEGDGAQEAAPEVEGGAGATEGQAATEDLNPAPQPGQKVGAKPEGTADEDVLPEEMVQERPNMSEDQEEAVESPEEDAAETPADEAEEGRLHFAKIPTGPAQQEARKPPVPVEARPKTPAGKSVTARTAPNAEVKSAARHPAEAFLEGWVGSIIPVVKAHNLSRSAKLAAVQKALNEFGPAMVEVINALTPPAPEDVTSVVEEAVNKAVAERDQQHAQALARIEAQLKALQSKRIPEEIVSVLAKRNGGVQRRSLSELPPPTQKSVTTNPTEAANTLSTGLVVKGMSAAEVARASVTAGGPTIRY